MRTTRESSPKRSPAPSTADTQHELRRQSRLALLLVALGAAAAGALLWWYAAHGSESAYLSRQGGADWIVYPQVRAAAERKNVAMTTVFRRTFNVGRLPQSARLLARLFREGEVLLNSKPVALPGSEGGGWKSTRETDVAALLRAGSNEIVVSVANSHGPPALWLLLEGEGLSIRSDSTWKSSLAGATELLARTADAPPPAPATGAGDRKESPAAGLGRCWPLLAVFAGAAVAAIALFLWWSRRRGRGSEENGLSTRGAFGIMAFVALLWIVLFWNNHGLLHRYVGFDARGHQQYIHYIQTKNALPLADEGWQMFQPPLYYLAAAAALDLCDIAVEDEAAMTVLRLIGLAAAVTLLGFLFASLRLIFAGNTRRQIAGLVLAACLPMHLYLFQYATNEPFTAAFICASIFLCLKILVEKGKSARIHAVLGACLGAAMLSKFSALLAVAAIVVVLTAASVVRKPFSLKAWLRTTGLAIAVCLLVCGWHYIRVWLHFGKPLVGNWDPAAGCSWWQDSGFQTAAYYMRFGQSLKEPLFSGFHSMWDGLYATLWGDGLCSGGAAAARPPSALGPPPWNHGLLGAGYLLALLPTAAIATGAVAALIRLIRKPRAEWFLLLALLAGCGFALVFMSLKVPSYAHAKAFYGIPGIVTLCALGAWGFDIAARRGRVIRLVLCACLGLWAVNAYASFWIIGESAQTRACQGAGLLYTGRHAEAVPLLQEALEIDPGCTEARWALSKTLMRLGRYDEAGKNLDQGMKSDPGRAVLHIERATWLELAMKSSPPGKEQMASLQLDDARRAVRLGPDNVEAHSILAMIMRREGRAEEAVAAFREVLRIDPQNLLAHRFLGNLYAGLGRPDDAARHSGYTAAIEKANSR